MKNSFKSTYPISSIQKSRYYHPLKNKNNDLLKLEVDLVGEIDFNRMNDVFQDVIKRHDSFRTVFAKNNSNKMMQAVCHKMTSELVLVYAENNLEQKIASYLNGQPDFSLENGPLVKAALFLTEYNQGRLVVTFHHLIMDEWSLELFLNDFFALYNQKELVPSPQYKKYVDWLSKQDQLEAKHFYQAYLANYQGGLPEKTVSQEGELTSQSYFLSVANYPRLLTAIHQQKITFSTLVQTVWGVVLNKSYDHHDLVIGRGTDGRTAPVKGLEKVIGAFSNVLPLRIKYTPEMTFLELLKLQQANYKEGMKYEQTPLRDIFVYHPLGEELFSTVITVKKDNLAKATNFNQENLQVNKIPSQQALDYPLSLTVYPSQTLEFLFKWHESSYQKGEIQFFFEGIESILAQLEIELNQPLKDLQVLSHQQFFELTEILNASNYAPLVQQSLTILTRELLQQGDNHVALIQGEKEVRYRELLSTAQGIAHFIVAGGGEPNDLVVIYGAASIELYQLVYGVILSGCAFLIIDKNLPTAEIEARLLAAKAKLIVGTENLPSELAVNFKLSLFQAIDLQEKLLKPVVTEATDTACVVYSSTPGEKGEGVLLTSQAVINLADYTANYMELVQPKMLALSSLSEDKFIFEMLSVLLSQGTLVLTTEAERVDNYGLSQRIKNEKINFITLQPNQLQEILQESPEPLTSLKWIVLRGGKINQELFERVDWEPSPSFYHGYGKTEATIYNTFTEVTPELEENQGQPSCLTDIFILNQELNPLPLNRIGEIYLAGIPLAKNYLAQENLSREKFIPHPWLKNTRLFKTGDLGRWNQAGQLEYLGPKADQFRIQGQRLNLPEIATVISSLPGIEDAKVYGIDEANEPRQLVCVYQGQELTAELIKSNLASRLAKFKLPQIYLHVEEFVVDSQGKFDQNYYTAVILTKTKKAHTQSKTAARGVKLKADSFQLSQTLLVNQLAVNFDCLICCNQFAGLAKLFKLKTITEKKEFFPQTKLGEPAVIVAFKKALSQLETVSRNRVEEKELDVKEVEKAEKEEKAESLTSLVEDRQREESQGNSGRLLPLAQAFAQQNKLDSQFNEVIVVTNPTWPLENYQRLQKVLTEKHPLLLSKIVKNQAGEFYYHLREEAFIPETIFDYQLSEAEFFKELDKIGERCQTEIKPSAGKLFQWAVIQTEKQDFLIFAASRFIVDQVSWQILSKDLAKYKLSIERGETVNVSPRTNSIISYANYCQDLFELGYFEGDLADWNAQWVGNQLEEKYQVPGRFKSSFTYSKTKTSQLLKQTAELEALILSAYSSVLINKNSWTEITIFMQSHGRYTPDEFLDFSNTLGCFTTIYPLKVKRQDKLVKQMRQLSAKLKKIPDAGLGYAYLAKNKNNQMLRASYQAKFKNYFNFLGDITQNDEQVPGVKVTNLSLKQELAQEFDLSLGTSCQAYIYHGQLTVQFVGALPCLNHTEIDKMLIQIKLLMDKFIAAGEEQHLELRRK